MADHKPNILIIEDDPYILRVYERKFQQEGFQITTARDGAEGVEKITAAAPDVILLDLVMPKKDGFEFMRDLKRIYPHKNIPVVVLTNLGQEHDVQRAEHLGISSYLLKSNMSIQDVFEKVRDTLHAGKSKSS